MGLFILVGDDGIGRVVEFPNNIECMARYRLSGRLAGFKAVMLPGS